MRAWCEGEGHPAEARVSFISARASRSRPNEVLASFTLTTTDWTLIERGKPQVRGIDHEASGLLDVRIELSRTPLRRWDYFFMNPTGVGIPVGMQSPRLAGSTVTIKPPDDKLKQYVEQVDARIAQANSMYEQEVLPRIEQQQDLARAQEEEREERLREARSEAEGL
jgi:hypothetical protein